MKDVARVAFDRDFARSQGIPTRLISYTMSALIAVTIVLSIRIMGIVQNKDDPSTLLPAIRIDELPELVSSGVIQGGMIPKAECCRNAIEWGVRRVFIIDGRVPHAILIEMLTNEGIGTMFTR